MFLIITFCLNQRVQMFRTTVLHSKLLFGSYIYTYSTYDDMIRIGSCRGFFCQCFIYSASYDRGTNSIWKYSLLINEKGI